MDNKNEVRFTNYDGQLLPRDFYNTERAAEIERPPEKTVENPREIGNKALSLPGEDLENPRLENMPEMQATLDIDRAPKTSSPNIGIKTTDKLSSEAVGAIDDAINKFEKDGNAANFYKDVRNFMEDNLRNSYQRELSYNKEPKK